MSGMPVHDGEKVFRIGEPKQGEYHLQVLKDDDYFSLYRFELSSYGKSDCGVGHFYCHKQPDAVFVNNLVGSLILANEIRSLRNLDYTVITTSTTESIKVNDAQQLCTILVDQLGILVTVDESRQLFERLNNKLLTK